MLKLRVSKYKDGRHRSVKSGKQNMVVINVCTPSVEHTHTEAGVPLMYAILTLWFPYCGGIYFIKQIHNKIGITCETYTMMNIWVIFRLLSLWLTVIKNVMKLFYILYYSIICTCVFPSIRKVKVENVFWQLRLFSGENV